MPNVVPVRRGRASHRTGQRASHMDDAQLLVPDLSMEVHAQESVDQYWAQQNLTPGSVGTEQLRADAVIANVLNVPGSVLIDENGITIADGALTLQDAYGNTVITAGGFTGAWRNFVQSGGVYNADFAVGLGTDIPVSEVGSGATVADYEASLTANLPYWVIASSGGTLKVVADTTTPSGFALEFGSTANGQVNRVYQDVPVSATVDALDTVRWTWRKPNAGGSTTSKVWVSYRDANHGLLGSRVALWTDTSAVSQSRITDFLSTGNALSQQNTAAYLRIEFEVTHTTHSAGVTVLLSAIERSTEAPISRFNSDNIDNTGTVTTNRLNGGGTVFPGGPVADDRVWRTDLNMEFFYDGSRWLSVQLFRMDLSWTSSAAASTSALAGVPSASQFGVSDIWLEDLHVPFYVNGGTALGASHKWVMVFGKRPSNNTTTTVKTVNVDSGSSSVWRTDTQAIDALMNNGTTHYVFSMAWTKTGTPGDLDAYPYVTYRLVAT